MKILDDLHAFVWNNPTANNCNTFLIWGEKKVLVDPGHYHLFSHVRDGLARISLSPEDIDFVFISHAHPDHTEALRVFADTSALIGFPEKEMEFVHNIAPQYREALGIADFEPHVLLQEGDLTIGDLEFQVIHTPGHSPGSLCLYWPGRKALFTGDVVFNQGIGRTDLPAGNGEQLKDSIKRIALLDIEYLLTGHGDIVSGREAVKRNFKIIEDYWFAYI
jgi:glyoxylase-like metal-dependent hydrolase (beta-lactamase superfamily II)